MLLIVDKAREETNIYWMLIMYDTLFGVLNM